MPKTSPEHEPVDKITDVEDEVVAVEIRPGHIRFEPLGEGAMLLLPRICG